MTSKGPDQTAKPVHSVGALCCTSIHSIELGESACG